MIYDTVVLGREDAFKCYSIFLKKEGFGQVEDYRDYIQKCLLNGERVQYMYEEHGRQAILEKLRRISENLELGEEQVTKEPEDEQAMLWVLPEDEVIEKGIYHYNKPDTELLVCAPPALMALILGEYKLAKKIYEKFSRSYENDTAIEILQDNRGPLLGGSEFRFCEACLLGIDMEPEETIFFKEKGMFEIELYWDSENAFFSKVCLHGNQKQTWQCIFKMMERLRKQEIVCEIFRDYKFLFICFALIKKMDMNNNDFWKDIYGLFSKVEERNVITEFIHRIFLMKIDVIHDVMSKEYRIIPCIEEYFRHADCLLLDGSVGEYIAHFIKNIDAGGENEFRNYCVTYFETVQWFGGEDSAELRKIMFDLINQKDFRLIELGFQKHLLREEWIEEYIEYFISQKNHTWILPYLIQKNWLIKEKTDGNIQ